MSNYNFVTIKDVNSHMGGFWGYEFGGKASYEGFCNYVWLHHDNDIYSHFDNSEDKGYEQSQQMMKDYLLNVGENLGDYDL